MSKRIRHKKPFFSVSFRIILLIFAAALTIGYISFFINPAKLWLPSLFGLYFIPLAIINFILLIIALVRRSRSGWIPFVILLPTLFFADYYVKIGKDEFPLPEEEIQLLTYNVGRFSSGKGEMTPENSRQKVSELISAKRPDIVCLQEFSTRDTSSIGNVYPQYPYRQYYFFRLKSGLFFGNLTLSKYPIIGGDEITFKSSTNLTLYSDIKYRDHTFRVYNNHLESNNISLTSLIKKLGKGYEELSNELSEAHEKMIGSNNKRSEQVDIVLRHIRTSNYQSIVCGDFNDNPMSFTFNKLHQGRKDTFKEAGEGFASTYSTLWPLLRIDYILVPESFEVLGHITERVPYSDHYPVMTRLSFNDDNHDIPD